MRYRLIGTWLRRSIDPLGPRMLDAPYFALSPRETRTLLRKAEAHHVLSTVLQNLPVPTQCAEFDQVREEAASSRIAGLALSTMLNHHARKLVAATKDMPVAIVKGPIFARTIYPNPALRAFTDIDLLASPDATSLDTVLRDQNFTCVWTGLEPFRQETKWIHRKTGGLVEVHTNLVHERHLRKAYSLTYQDLEGDHGPATMLAIAVTHGVTHHFAFLRHVVDICQAARALPPIEEERFEALTMRTGTRLAAIVGLVLAHRVIGEPRCLDIAQGLSPSPHPRLAKILSQGANLAATSNSWLLYNTWRRFLFRELLRYGSLH